MVQSDEWDVVLMEGVDKVTWIKIFWNSTPYAVIVAEVVGTVYEHYASLTAHALQLRIFPDGHDAIIILFSSSAVINPESVMTLLNTWESNNFM